MALSTRLHEITGATRLLGVMGWPIAHTRSPRMQNAAIGALGLDWAYLALPVPPEQLAAALPVFCAAGFVGLNATIPHKQALVALVDELAPAARAIGAVNTVQFVDGRSIGHNTDAAGYARTVEVEGDFAFDGRVVLQLGAGGVGRAMAAGAAEAGAARVVIHARRREAADRLAADMRPHYPRTRFEAIALHEELAEAARTADLIANATPLGMKRGDPLPIPAELLERRHVVFDTVYTPEETALLAAAAASGARPVGGLGMLARQGSRSLAIWSGMQPDEDLMLRVLREETC